MTAQETLPAVSSARSSKRWLRRRSFWVAVAAFAFLVWLITPARYSSGGIQFTVRHIGAPGTLTFRVSSIDGQPLPGAAVMSESFSGTTEEVLTDSNGIATIRPGEDEVLAVFIEGREFRFSWPGIFEHFAPGCSRRGLTFNVLIRNDRNG